MKILKIGLIVFLSIYVVVCLILYLMQEKLLFHPYQIPTDYTYQFSAEFEEINLNSNDNDLILNGLHFKSVEKKGIVLFFHGNGGTVNDWGEGADFYTSLGYDIFYFDYRGYGKSGGKIKSEKQLMNDAKAAYEYVKTKFSEDKIIVSGTSIGTGMASQIAAVNNPRLLLLNTPYSSLVKLIRQKMKIVPSFLVKYKFKTTDYIESINCPIYVFHGDNDVVIPHSHSLELKANHSKINLNIAEGFGHNDITSSKLYNSKMITILK
jgi:pimeloyl-ACP methyl ester carboxylesterase